MAFSEAAGFLGGADMLGWTGRGKEAATAQGQEPLLQHFNDNYYQQHYYINHQRCQ